MVSVSIQTQCGVGGSRPDPTGVGDDRGRRSPEILLLFAGGLLCVCKEGGASAKRTLSETHVIHDLKVSASCRRKY